MRAHRILLLSCLALPVALARAEDLELALRHGRDGGDIEGTGLALRLGPVWSKDWGDWRLRLHPGLEATRFRYGGSKPAAGPDNLNVGAGVALLRMQRADGRGGPYAEIGLGAAWFSRDKLGGKEFSTHFQFTEQIGLGVEFPGGWFAGWRYSHYSNANIDKPNDGLDFHQLMIGVHF